MQTNHKASIWQFKKRIQISKGPRKSLNINLKGNWWVNLQRKIQNGRGYSVFKYTIHLLHTLFCENFHPQRYEELLQVLL